MAFDTVRRETDNDVVRALGILKVGPVATDAIIPHAIELGRISTAMAVHATQIPMRTE